ncbi:MAG: hypothetical protein KKA07_15060 [Bacteroidetes bacterium]|nr:hypothetical protein [Bacteroidota bacterium]
MTSVLCPALFAQTFTPPGKISLVDTYGDRIIVFEQGKKKFIYLPESAFGLGSCLRENNVRWANDSLLLFEEAIMEEYNARIMKSDLVLVNMDGVKVGQVYSAKSGENITSCCFSPDKSLIMFSSYDVPKESRSDEILTYQLSGPISLTLIDFQTKEVVLRIDTFYVHHNSCGFTQNAFSHDNKKIIYSIGYGNIFVVHDTPTDKGKTYTKTDNKLPGVYIRNLIDGKDSLVALDAKMGSWSGNGKYISYKKGNGLYVVDLQTDSCIKIFTPKEKEYLIKYLWSPDSNYLILIIKTKYGYRERFVRVPDGELFETEQMGIGPRFPQFTWTN